MPAPRLQALPHQQLVRDDNVEGLDGDVEKFQVADFRADHVTAGHVRLVARDDRDNVVPFEGEVGCCLKDAAVPADPQDEHARLSRHAFEAGNGLADHVRIRQAISPDVEGPRRGHDPFSHLRTRSGGGAQLGRLLAKVDAHQLGADGRDEPHERGGPDQVGHRVGNRDVVDERGFFRVGNGQALDRLARRSDHRRFREGTRQ